jgi:hypothetical protein
MYFSWIEWYLVYSIEESGSDSGFKKWLIISPQVFVIFQINQGKGGFYQTITYFKRGALQYTHPLEPPMNGVKNIIYIVRSVAAYTLSRHCVHIGRLKKRK